MNEEIVKGVIRSVCEIGAVLGIWVNRVDNGKLERIFMDQAMFEQEFGNEIDVEEGKVVAYIGDTVLCRDRLEEIKYRSLIEAYIRKKEDIKKQKRKPCFHPTIDEWIGGM